MNIELPVTFTSFGCLYLGIFGFKSERYFCTLDFCMFNLPRPLRFVCLVYSRGKEKSFDLGGNGSIPTEVKRFFFTSCGSLIPFTRANAQWVIHGFN